MRNLLTNTNLIIIVSISWVLISLCLSFVCRNEEWFQASGGIMTIAGIFLVSRKQIRLSKEELNRDEDEVNGGHFVQTNEEKESEKQQKKDIKSYKLSIPLMIVGTLIWAYGGIILRACHFKILSISINF